jgi:carboxylesterase type B
MFSIACVLYQLHSKEPLFKRCVSMSGTPIMLKPLSLDVAETVYTSIMKELGLEDASAEKRIQRLKTIEPDELVKKTPMSLPFLPILDGDIVPEHTTFAKLAKNVRSVPGMKWCEELMIGDSQHDGNVFVFMGLAQLKVGIASALTISLHTNLPASAADAVLQAYDICPTMEDDAAMDLILRLATDIGYVAPAVAYAQSFPGKTYYYQFNEPNTWDGPFKGNSTHMLDAAFLFQNFNEHMSKEPKMIAKDLATDFVKFSNGIKPWVEHDMGKKLARVFGPSNKSRLRMAENNGWGDGRRDVLWKLNKEDKVDLDKLSVAWDMFIAGR